jgi:hypothetical protein
MTSEGIENFRGAALNRWNSNSKLWGIVWWEVIYYSEYRFEQAGLQMLSYCWSNCSNSASSAIVQWSTNGQVRDEGEYYGRVNFDKLLEGYSESNFQAGFGMMVKFPAGWFHYGLKQTFLGDNEHVRAVAPWKNFLEFAAADGWDLLCKFLGKEVLDELYHHDSTTNKGRLDTCWWVAVKAVTLKYGVPHSRGWPVASNCIAASVFELFLNQWCLTDLATVVLYDFPTTIDNDKVS